MKYQSTKKALDSKVLRGFLNCYQNLPSTKSSLASRSSFYTTADPEKRIFKKNLRKEEFSMKFLTMGKPTSWVLVVSLDNFRYTLCLAIYLASSESLRPKKYCTKNPLYLIKFAIRQPTYDQNLSKHA